MPGAPSVAGPGADVGELEMMRVSGGELGRCWVLGGERGTKPAFVPRGSSLRSRGDLSFKARRGAGATLGRLETAARRLQQLFPAAPHSRDMACAEWSKRRCLRIQQLFKVQTPLMPLRCCCLPGSMQPTMRPSSCFATSPSRSLIFSASFGQGLVSLTRTTPRPRWPLLQLPDAFPVVQRRAPGNQLRALARQPHMRQSSGRHLDIIAKALPYGRLAMRSVGFNCRVRRLAISKKR